MHKMYFSSTKNPLPLDWFPTPEKCIIISRSVTKMKYSNQWHFMTFFLLSKQKLKNDNELVQMTYILNGSFLLLHLASLPLLGFGWLLCCTHGCIMYIDFQFYVQFLHYCTFTINVAKDLLNTCMFNVKVSFNYRKQ